MRLSRFEEFLECGVSLYGHMRQLNGAVHTTCGWFRSIHPTVNLKIILTVEIWFKFPEIPFSAANAYNAHCTHFSLTQLVLCTRVTRYPSSEAISIAPMSFDK